MYKFALLTTVTLLLLVVLEATLYWWAGKLEQRIEDNLLGKWKTRNGVIFFFTVHAWVLLLALTPSIAWWVVSVKFYFLSVLVSLLNSALFVLTNISDECDAFSHAHAAEAQCITKHS